MTESPACVQANSDAGDFSLPAVWRSCPLVLTVSTTGASPALAAHCAIARPRRWGSTAAGLAALLAELRSLALAQVADAETSATFEDWTDPRWLALWTEQGPDSTRRALLDRFEK